MARPTRTQVPKEVRVRCDLHASESISFVHNFSIPQQEGRGGIKCTKEPHAEQQLACNDGRRVKGRRQRALLRAEE
ncbi:hypothetical protein GW17_00024038 [Ensete ventricosum]|nr:hypothetical protein GW17_00024038 [Ensete ventricosum]RZS01439.1 hypothetical protein BHM03_00031303 [Ensete ventricosum]